MSLQRNLETIAADFARKIVEALRGASIEDLSGAAGSSGGRATAAPKSSAASKKASARLDRRSADDIAHTLQRFVSLLQHHTEGLRAEQLREILFLDKRELPRPIALGLSTGALAKSGQKRATVYTLANGRTSAKTTKAPSKRAKRKAATKK